MTPTNNKARRRRQPRFPRTLPPEIVRELKRLLQNMPRQPQIELSPFDQVVGKLVSEALAGSATGCMSEAQRESIAAQADAGGFKLKEHLEGRSKLILASWNQLHSLHPDEIITTFLRALKSKQQKLRRGVLRRLYRAKDNYRRIYPELSGS